MDAYIMMGYEMDKPYLRANLESQLVDICNGTRAKDDVLREQLGKYRRIFEATEDKIAMFAQAIHRYLNQQNHH